MNIYTVLISFLCISNVIGTIIPLCLANICISSYICLICIEETLGFLPFSHSIHQKKKDTSMFNQSNIYEDILIIVLFCSKVSGVLLLKISSLYRRIRIVHLFLVYIIITVEVGSSIILIVVAVRIIHSSKTNQLDALLSTYTCCVNEPDGCRRMT